MLSVFSGIFKHCLSVALSWDYNAFKHYLIRSCTEQHFLYNTLQSGGTELSTQLSSKKAVFSSFCRKPKVFQVGCVSIFPMHRLSVHFVVNGMQLGLAVLFIRSLGRLGHCPIHSVGHISVTQHELRPENRVGFLGINVIIICMVPSIVVLPDHD
jgi:hypothetical protein